MYCLPSISVYTNKDLIFCNNPTGLEQKDRNCIDKKLFNDVKILLTIDYQKSWRDD